MSAPRLVSVVFAAFFAMISVNNVAFAQKSSNSLAASATSTVSSACCNGTITGES